MDFLPIDTLNPEKRKYRLLFVACGTLASFVVGLIDYLTGSDISFFAFYLLPIFLVTWNAGVAAGLFISSLCLLIWLASNVFWPMSIPYDPSLLLAFSIIEKIIFFCIFLICTAWLRELVIRERRMTRYDPTTGLGNGHLFRENLAEAIERQGVGTVAACIDVDYYDEFFLHNGYRKAEALMKHLALRINGSFNRTYRTNDDRICVIFQEPEQREVERRMETLGQELRTYLHESLSMPISPPIAYVYFQGENTDADAMIHKLNEALRQVKLDGGHGIGSASA